MSGAGSARPDAFGRVVTDDPHVPRPRLSPPGRELVDLADHLLAQVRGCDLIEPVEEDLGGIPVQDGADVVDADVVPGCCVLEVSDQEPFQPDLGALLRLLRAVCARVGVMPADPLGVVGEVDADRDPKVRGLIGGQRLLAVGELVAPDEPGSVHLAHVLRDR